ncbi:uncharacterized protein LOC125531221 isoform X1 [Triticum urartu]|uniref:uncharacterized protein LOC125531221 isoform X1 n=1 Tax=Triticum urartu TaxID=4572 RepID=UPI0020443D2B|nr:uncharacterized protein LOC125531221 isoform X1 [Triticum urartu]
MAHQEGKMGRRPPRHEEVDGGVRGDGPYTRTSVRAAAWRRSIPRVGQGTTASPPSHNGGRCAGPEGKRRLRRIWWPALSRILLIWRWRQGTQNLSWFLGAPDQGAFVLIEAHVRCRQIETNTEILTGVYYTGRKREMQLTNSCSALARQCSSQRRVHKLVLRWRT